MPEKEAGFTVGGTARPGHRGEPLYGEMDECTVLGGGFLSCALVDAAEQL